jgi:hypothetical protein
MVSPIICALPQLNFDKLVIRLGYRIHLPSLLPWRPMGTVLGPDMDLYRFVHGLSECPTVILLASLLRGFLSFFLYLRTGTPTIELTDYRL